ncbi:asparagine synthase (glutamine-hydrolyzing) [Aestuariirhabdus haliotis]|uniref:asparagine synthase (glutamine-hydrolyzing) n=1 Tax=Aestuariirhabdus haliotis TaxID=2918751 RepID=UPI0020BE962D|nr:asparagine synthase (glutamine-hydrolyzing) [Aestuariirhabdus haliotis]MCL6419723.1 asparagine synthase (glutamine-hydrolyzing) [Aestuariirhabdus haliotis]
MCGIAGGSWSNNSNGIQKKLNDALDLMKNRGPDDQGFELDSFANGVVGLGHSRLSIIDLSPAGHQPMHSNDHSITIVFNGEIYNYRELRAELESHGHDFCSGSDTEVLLQAWQQWGEACLLRLVGMFAFVVFDRVKGTLTCVRDAFGIKPFFYTMENGAMLFASEMSAIKALKSEKVDLDWQTAYEYLVYGDYDSSQRSFLDGVFHLMPGHIITFDLNKRELSQPECWWQPDITESTTLSFEEAANQLRELFLDSVRMHLRSDVPIGAALSGGVDSSAIVCAMRFIDPDLPINTFSYIARGSSLSEEKWVDHINTYVGADIHKVEVSGSELAADLDEMIRSQGEPFMSTSIYAQYRVFRLARESGVTVTLDGQGADELLAGYSGYPGQRVRSLIENGRFISAFMFLNNWAKWPGRNKLDGIKRSIGEFLGGRLYDFSRKLVGKPGIPLWIDEKPLIEKGLSLRFPLQAFSGRIFGRRVMSELALSLTRRGIPGLLRHGDRNSMRFSVESRVPFLTIEMANFLLSLPESYLISEKGETKHIFRAAMRGIVPDDILDRKDKVGFETPEHEWLLSVSGTIREWLSVDLNLPFLNQKVVLEEFDLVVSGEKKSSPYIWRWINFSRWYHIFILE